MRAMATVDLPYVQTVRGRKGEPRYYYRRRGFARVTLPGPIGSPAFLIAYQQAGGVPADHAEKRHAPRSVAALAVAWYRSPAFTQRAPLTQRAYRGAVDRFVTAYGGKHVASFDAAYLKDILASMADRPAAAANMRKRLNSLFQLAVDMGWIPANPVSGIRQPTPKTDGHAPWDEDEIERYLVHWKPGTRERLAMMLLLYTGQRRSDVVTMGAQHVRDGMMTVRQQKTGHRLRIPVHPALAEELQGFTGLTYLTTQYGAPFTAAGFGNWFRATAKEAGVEKTAHGLRKAAGRRLAEAGCSAKEIAAVLGHASLTEVERYTRSADQALLAKSAMARIGNAR